MCSPEQAMRLPVQMCCRWRIVSWWVIIIIIVIIGLKVQLLKLLADIVKYDTCKYCLVSFLRKQAHSSLQDGKPALHNSNVFFNYNPDFHQGITEQTLPVIGWVPIQGEQISVLPILSIPYQLTNVQTSLEFFIEHTVIEVASIKWRTHILWWKSCYLIMISLYPSALAMFLSSL